MDSSGLDYISNPGNPIVPKPIPFVLEQLLTQEDELTTQFVGLVTVVQPLVLEEQDDVLVSGHLQFASFTQLLLTALSQSGLLFVQPLFVQSFTSIPPK